VRFARRVEVLYPRDGSPVVPRLCDAAANGVERNVVVGYRAEAGGGELVLCIYNYQGVHETTPI